jgi:hypothetical protein
LDSTENGLSWGQNTIRHDETDTEARQEPKRKPSCFIALEHISNRAISWTNIGALVSFDPYQVLLVRVGRCADSTLERVNDGSGIPEKSLSAYITREQRVERESASLAFVIGIENDYDVFDSHNNRQSPYNDRQGAKQVVESRRLRERRGEHVDWTRANVTVDNSC